MLSKIKRTTTAATQMLNITDDVADIVSKAEVKDGIVVVYSLHTTCGIRINENTDPVLKNDIVNALSVIFPKNHPWYEHKGGNADAHIKATITGESATILIENWQMKLGRWQAIYLCEFDGPRDREFLVKVLAG